MSKYYKRCSGCFLFTWHIDKGESCSWCGLDYEASTYPETSEDEPVEVQFEKAWSE